MNMRVVNRLANGLDDAFDAFLSNGLWPLLAVMALIVYVVGGAS